MLAVYFLCSLLVIANTADVKLRPIPSTLPNFCDVDRYDGIRYTNDVLHTRIETSDSKSKCVKDCYEYENQACRSVTFYSDDRVKPLYWCDFHGSSISDSMATETDYHQKNTSTYFDIHGCGATSCGRRYDFDNYYLQEVTNGYPNRLSPALNKTTWLALLAVHGGDAARFCTAAFISVYNTSYETDMLVTTASCVTETSEVGKPPRLVDFKAITVYPDVRRFPDDIKTALGVKNVIIPTHSVVLSYFQDGTDLALIQLERPVRFSQVDVNPLCSPTQENRDLISDTKCLAFHFVIAETGEDAHSLLAIESTILKDSNDPYFFTHPCTGRKSDDGAGKIRTASLGKFSFNQCSDHSGGVIACLENNKWVLRRMTAMRVDGQRLDSYGSLNYRHSHWIESNKMEMTPVRQIMKKLKDE